MQRLARVLLLVVLAGGLVPAGAAAHAQLEDTAPQRGAVLDRQPAQVTFAFSEPVEGSFGAMRVFDATGREVQAGEPFHPGARASAIAVGLDDGLPDGTYTATYRVVSADAHVVSGGFAFSIGKAGAAGATVAELLVGGDAGPVTGTALSVARGLQYLAIALGVGALAFLIFVWRRTLPGPSRTACARSLAACALGALSGAAAVVVQGAEAGGASAWAALAPDVIRETLVTRNAIHVAATALWAGGFATLLSALPSATRALPDEMDRRAYEPLPGWDATVVRERLDRPIETDFGPIEEQVGRIVFTGDGSRDRSIPPGAFRDFPISGGGGEDGGGASAGLAIAALVLGGAAIVRGRDGASA